MIQQFRFLVLIVGLIFCALAADSPTSLIGKTAPDFILHTLDNDLRHSLKDFRGEVVLLDFWASWCPPCKKSLPALVKLQAQYEGLQILTINIDDKKKNAVEFMTRLDLNLIALYDQEKTVVESYNVTGMPTALLIDRKGVVRSIFSGYTEENMKEIGEAIGDLL